MNEKKCLQCEKVFFIKKKSLKEQRFCSSDCVNLASRKHGILYLERQQTCLSKYGVKSHFQDAKVRKTIEDSNIQKYGAKYFLQTNEFKEAMKSKNIEKYGVTHFFQLKSFRENAKKVSLKRFGTLFPSQSPLIKEKIRKTNLKKFGVEYVFFRDEIKARLSSPEIQKKKHETMKRKGTYKKRVSRTELSFFKLLCNFFSEEDILQQEIMNDRWAIDFFIVPINVYIQLDGVYWHGLDRPIDEIKKSKSARDKIIFKKYHTDKEQNVWFKENNLILKRLTDVELRSKDFNIEKFLNVQAVK